MVQCDVAAITRFVSELRSPDKILKGCERFHAMEPRDIVYLVARKIISENPSSEYHILAGIEVLLLTWNAVYLQRQPEKVKGRLEDDILEAYRKTKDDRGFLENAKLETVDLKEPDIVNRVKARLDQAEILFNRSQHNMSVRSLHVRQRQQTLSK